MNNEKREAIERAVEELEGKWPDERNPTLTTWNSSDVTIFICTRSEFEQVAREMGYINGYKWGVEYPTNGKKPDLPDDMLVDVLAGRWLENPEKVGEACWQVIDKFRIVDERYKPKATSKPEVDNWHARGELPPVGIVCECRRRDSGKDVWFKCKVIAHDDGEPVVRVGSYYDYLRKPRDQFLYRPIQTERDKVIELACIAFDRVSDEFPPVQNKALVKLFDKLYDIGMLKMPEGDNDQ